MSTDKLKQFVSLRQGLLQEKAGLEARLTEIDRALGVAAKAAPAAEAAPVRRRGRPARVAVAVAPTAAAAPAPVARKGRGGRRRARNGVSLREAVLVATKGKALTRQEILAAVKKAGYVFTAKDPLNSLSTLLYSDKKSFKNSNGKFSPV